MNVVISRRIICDPHILGGKPVIKGTRISVEFILELIRSGMSFEEILKEYKHLRRTDLEMAVAFAKHAVSREEIVPLKFVPSRS